MTVPDYQSLMLPVLSISTNEEVRFRDIVERLADQLGIPPEERGELLPSGKQTVFNNRVHWAKTYLSKAGLLESTRRGHFKSTPCGQQVLASQPSRIDVPFLEQLTEFQGFKAKARASQTMPQPGMDPLVEVEFDSQTKTPDEIMRTAHKQIEAALAQDLLDRIRTAPSDFFERLIVNLLPSMGFGGSAADAGRAIGRRATTRGRRDRSPLRRPPSLGHSASRGCPDC